MMRSRFWAVLTVFCLLLPSAVLANVVTLPITQVWQHKDTTMQCTAPGGNALVHPWNHAITTSPADPHCSYYCAPASISMYALYRGRAGLYVQQDQIYDHGKFTQGEIQADGIIQTHGVGMFDAVSPGGVGGIEVQTAFQWAVGVPPVQWGVNYGLPFTGDLVILHINGNTPILWCDHFGYPSEVNPPLADDFLEVNGHAKIIAGYDDMGTPGIYADDLYLIYDPWPGTNSPYWVAQGSVLDARDLYITNPNIVPSDSHSVGSLKSKFGH